MSSAAETTRNSLASAGQSTRQSVVAARQSVSETTNSVRERAADLTVSRDQMFNFSMVFLMGMAIMGLSFTFLPVLVLAPQKFGMLFGREFYFDSRSRDTNEIMNPC